MARGRTIRLTQLLVVAIKIWFIKCENRGWKWKGFNSICSWYIDRYYISIFVQYIDRYFNIRSIYWSIFRYFSIFVQYIDRYLNIFRCYFQYFIGYINTILSLFQCCRNNFRYVIDHINTCSSKYRRRFFFIEKPVFCVSIIINMILKIFQYSWKYLQYISRNGKCISSGGLDIM